MCNRVCNFTLNALNPCLLCQAYAKHNKSKKPLILQRKPPKPLRNRGVHFGGGGGSRTRVRKQLDRNLSERSPLFTFPHRSGKGHPLRISSFMIHGAGKAYRTHVHRSSTLQPGSRSFRGERAPNQAAKATLLLSVKFKKLPVL